MSPRGPIPNRALPYRITVGRRTGAGAAGKTIAGSSWEKRTGVPAGLSFIRGDVNRLATGHLETASHTLQVNRGQGPGGEIRARDVFFVTAGPAMLGEYFQVGPVDGASGSHQQAVVALDPEEKKKAQLEATDALT